MKITRWEDILFEKRNKAYGAYDLRVNYHSRLNRSFFITLSSFALLAGLLILLKNQKPIPHPELTFRTEGNHMQEKFLVYQNELHSPSGSPIKAPSVPTQTPQTDPNSFKPVTDPIAQPSTTDPILLPISPSAGLTASNTSGNVFNNGNELPNSLSFPEPNMNIASVEIAPDFPGGIEKFYAFLMQKIKFTDEARERGINTRVFVSFIVSKDGSIQNILFKNNPGAGLDESILNVLKNSPRWKPGIYKGEAVNTEMVLPINFVLR